MEEPFLDIRQLADHLSVSRRTVEAWLGSGDIPHMTLPGRGRGRKMRRFEASQVREWLSSLGGRRKSYNGGPMGLYRCKSGKNKSPVWRYWFTLDSQRTYGSTDTTDYTKAKEIYIQVYNAALEGRRKPKGRIALGEAIAEYLTWCQAENRESTYKDKINRTHVILRYFDAKRRLASIDVEDIERYKLDHFKIKLSGDAEFDTQRVIRIAEILRGAVSGPPRITLDGNEQFEALDDLTATLARVAKSATGRTLLDGLLYIEQPLPRKHTFDPGRNAAMKSLETFAPALIDEADADVHAFKRAVELGYRGVSVKNCKGVFRALLNFGLCAQSGGELFQSSEDLTNLPVVALQQDLATVAALGLTHAERNGHHYFAGLAHLPDSEARAAAESHPDLYETHDEAVTLKIHDGALSIGSLQCSGYGYAVPIDVIQRTPLAHWRYPEAE